MNKFAFIVGINDYGKKSNTSITKRYLPKSI